MSVRLFVGNLPYNATEAELREHFSAVGPLAYVHLPTDRETGKPRGFAFVEFSDAAQAEEAVRRFNNQLFKGRPITINEARAREAGPRSSAPSRPAPRFEPAARPDFDGPPPAPPAGRSFGPDAPPRRKGGGKGKAGSKGERAPKGPLREVVRGQFFGVDDDSSDDDLDLENFASRAGDETDEHNEHDSD